LLGYFFKKETDRSKKDFLLIIFAYSIIMFFVMLPIIQEASIRYFIVLLFLPFLFLGLWLKFFLEKNERIGKFILIPAIAMLLFSNLFTLKEAAGKYYAKSTNDVTNSTLGETEIMLDYILADSNYSKNVLLSGKNLYAIRFYKPLAYLAEKKEVNIKRIYSDKKITPGIPLFYVLDTKDKFKPEEMYTGRLIKSVGKFNNVMILNLEN
jgi:hypothetical protein